MVVVPREREGEGGRGRGGDLGTYTEEDAPARLNFYVARLKTDFSKKKFILFNIIKIANKINYYKLFSI